MPMWGGTWGGPWYGMGWFMPLLGFLVMLGVIVGIAALTVVVRNAIAAMIIESINLRIWLSLLFKSMNYDSTSKTRRYEVGNHAEMVPTGTKLEPNIQFFLELSICNFIYRKSR